MIVARSPLRITLGGGGTDLPSYARGHGGFLIAATIDRYVYACVQRRWGRGVRVRHGEIEEAADVDGIRHPLVREVLRLHGEGDLDVAIAGDVPGGSGLGSSGSLSTALIKALLRLRSRTVAASDLAERACHVEIEVLGLPVGRQDPYAAAHGGIQCFEFGTDGAVRVTPLGLSARTREDLEARLLLFSSSVTRAAADVLADQDRRTRAGEAALIEELHRVKEAGLQSRAALEAGDLEAFGRLMHDHWVRKRMRSPGMSSPAIDRGYEAGRRAGAVGGKLVGAGGGGFLMFLAEDPPRLRRAMAEEGWPELTLHFEFEGTKLLS